METVGHHIERMQELLNAPLIPPPSWARRWQTEAEHVLFLAHTAKDEEDIEQLRMLDGEAERLVKDRESRTSKG